MAHGKSGGLKLKLCRTIRFVFLLIMCILRHCTCCFLPVIKAVLYPNDCRGVHAWKCIFNYFVKYVVFSRTCVLSGTALVSFLTTSERCEGYKAWGLFNHCNCNLRVPQRNEAPMLIYTWWQISRSEIEICNANLYGLGFLLIMCILRHCTCWFCQYVIKAVLCFNSNDCRGVQAENVYLICITACLWCK